MANNLAITGAVYNSATAKFGSSLSGGTGVSASNVFASGGFTIEAWLKAPATSSGAFVALGSTSTMWVGVSSGNLAAFIGTGSSQVGLNAGQGLGSGGAWRHVAVTAGPSGLGLFLDGNLVASSATALSATAATFSTPLGVRNFEGSFSFPWNGEVDEVAVWTGARYSGAFAPPTVAYAGSEAGLAALYHLDGNGTDSSGAAVATTVTVPATATSGQAFTATYTLAAGVTAFAVQFRGGADAGARVALSTSPGSLSFTPAGAGAETVRLYSAAAGGTVLAESSTINVAAGGAVIAPDDPGLVYSPYTWNVTHSAATAWNPGAYFRTLFSGGNCVLGFDVSNNGVPKSQIWWRVNNGPWTSVAVGSTVTCAVPAVMQSNADVPYHLLEVVFKSIDSAAGLNRWNSPAQTAIVFTGLTLAVGGVVAAPGRAGLNILIFGDSITEGVRTLGEALATTPDDNDAMHCWAFAQARLLGAEVGIVGWGGTGYTAAFANVPVFGSSFGSLAGGVARSFSPLPDLIVVNHGANDLGDYSVPARTALAAVAAACPGVPIAVLNPLTKPTSVPLQTAASGVAAARYVATAGFCNSALGIDSVALHPSGPNGVGAIAPQVAAALRPLLSKAAVVARWTH